MTPEEALQHIEQIENHVYTLTVITKGTLSLIQEFVEGKQVQPDRIAALMREIDSLAETQP